MSAEELRVNMEEARIHRRQRKAAITRHLGKLSRLVVEEDVSGVEERLVQIKTSFGQFEETHDAYHNLLTENNDIVASEEWFGNIEASYIDGVQTAKPWLSSLNNSINVKPEGHDEPVVDVAKLVALMSVPKLEIDKFSGDPLEYQTFLAIFDETIDSRIDDPQIKLTQIYDRARKGGNKELCIGWWG